MPFACILSRFTTNARLVSKLKAVSGDLLKHFSVVRETQILDLFVNCLLQKIQTYRESNILIKFCNIYRGRSLHYYYLDSKGVSGGETPGAAMRGHCERVRAQVHVLRQPADQAMLGVHGQPAGQATTVFSSNLTNMFY